ncbi:lysis system i-spanin subunit Rz [Pseudomonas simiae]|uniref:lysis system i-spanin subunit Rz n=1 Tax=Pseudomonas simiae TaxID=321846 RepID=UPI002735FF97|nr:lysis system i-spanin subunit Rz [Pseudomonas simiae]WLG73600.1 lysis system i-spanin subunit Rz [Pseudomonas simiae]WLH17968.1 lysis system i-spanin subunit Rz [Pseudomonas simiae]
MREVLLPLVLCLVAFVAFDILQGQRDTARLERDNALFEAAGLREAARISGEMLADRDAIDLKRTVELKDELDSNLEQRRAVGDGRQRLRINATCSAAGTEKASAGGVADAATAELAANARPDYFTLRDQLALSKQMILGLQDYVHQVCLR